MFRESVFEIFFVQGFRSDGGALFNGFGWFSMVLEGGVSDRTNGRGSVGRSVGQSCARSVRRPLGRSGARSVGVMSRGDVQFTTPAGFQKIFKRAMCDLACGIFVSKAQNISRVGTRELKRAAL